MKYYLLLDKKLNIGLQSDVWHYMRKNVEDKAFFYIFNLLWVDLQRRLHEVTNGNS